MKLFKRINYPGRFESQAVLMHIKCEDELKVLIEESGKKVKFAAQFNQRLSFLVQNGANAVKHTSWFEVLKNEQGISAIRFISIDNIRILYVLQHEKAYLLHSFKETSKPNSKDAKGYRHACEIAKKRIEEIREEEQE